MPKNQTPPNPDPIDIDDILGLLGRAVNSASAGANAVVRRAQGTPISGEKAPEKSGNAINDALTTILDTVINAGDDFVHGAVNADRARGHSYSGKRNGRNADQLGVYPSGGNWHHPEEEAGLSGVKNDVMRRMRSGMNTIDMEVVRPIKRTIAENNQRKEDRKKEKADFAINNQIKRKETLPSGLKLTIFEQRKSPAYPSGGNWFDPESEAGLEGIITNVKRSMNSRNGNTKKRGSVEKANFGRIAENAARAAARLSESGGIAGRIGRGLGGLNQAVRVLGRGVMGIGEGVRSVGRRVRNSLTNANPFGGGVTPTSASQGVTRTPAQYVGTPEEYLRRNLYDMQANGIGERFGQGMANTNPFGSDALTASFLQGLMGTPEEYLRRNASPSRKYTKPVYGKQELQLPLEPEGDMYYNRDLENIINSPYIEDIMPWGQALYSANSPFPKNDFDEIQGIQRANPPLDNIGYDPDSGIMAATRPIQRGKGMTPVAGEGLNPNWRNNSNPDWQFPETIDNYWQNIYEPTNQRVPRANTSSRLRPKPGGYSPTRQGYRRFNEIIADAKANPPLPTEPVPYNSLLNAYQNPRSDLYNYRTDPEAIAYLNAKSKERFDRIENEKRAQLGISTPMPDNYLGNYNVVKDEIPVTASPRDESLQRTANQMRKYYPDKTDAELKLEAILSNDYLNRQFNFEEKQAFYYNAYLDTIRRKQPNLSKEDQIAYLLRIRPELKDYHNSLLQPAAQSVAETVAEPPVTKPRGRKTGLNPKWADLNGGLGKSMGKRDTINKFMDNSFAKSMSKPTSNNRSIKSSNKYFN